MLLKDVYVMSDVVGEYTNSIYFFLTEITFSGTITVKVRIVRLFFNENAFRPFLVNNRSFDIATASHRPVDFDDYSSTHSIYYIYII